MSSAKATPVSPLAPTSVPELPPIGGVGIATAQAGIRYSGRTDVLYLAMQPGTQAAGVFTRSKCPSAPVDWCREALAREGARALIVNSGNANAFTGARGRDAVALTAKIGAEAAGCRPDEIFIASTGVIGEPLDATKFEGVLADCASRTETGPEAWAAAAQAIMARMMATAGAELLREADCLVPVPLHWTRLWRRRFNQAALLGRGIGRLTGLPCETATLARVKATRSQVGLSRAARATNLQGAFRVPAAARARLQGRKVLLIDDVATTGSTANAASRALLRGGASSVDVLTFALVASEAG